MKTRLLLCLFFLLSVTAFAQQELRLVNNTGQTLIVYLRVDGTLCAPLCSDYLESETFRINPGTTSFDSFLDFDVLSPPVRFTQGPGGICNPPPLGSGPCNGVGSMALCDSPLWV
jgi:hypothetical protein